MPKKLVNPLRRQLGALLNAPERVAQSVQLTQVARAVKAAIVHLREAGKQIR